jgi:hypothetical protein
MTTKKMEETYGEFVKMAVISVLEKYNNGETTIEEYFPVVLEIASVLIRKANEKVQTRIRENIFTGRYELNIFFKD